LAVAVTTPPPQVVLAFGVGATTMPLGKVSVKGEVRMLEVANCRSLCRSITSATG
jgi:hypothetical protein